MAQASNAGVGLALSFLWLLGCGGGGASSQPSARAPFTEQDARLFDDGMDLIASVLALEGRWRQEWQQELHDRVQAADAIAVVSVRTLRTDTDPQGRVTHRLFVLPTRFLRGEIAGDEIELASREDNNGFRTIDGHFARLESGSFVAFLKWFVDEEGRERAHWHLSPGSEEVVAAVARLAEEGGDAPKATVIVHEQSE